jgi:hypothetical protein
MAMRGLWDVDWISLDMSKWTLSSATDRFSSMLSSTAASLQCRPRSPLEIAKGFSLYMVKAVMNGRADEVIDLAKTNLWRRG